MSNLRVFSAGFIVAVVAAACGRVENRTGVIGAPTQDNTDRVLDSVTITRRARIDVDLDNNVRGNSTILASTAPSDVVRASGAVFTVERAPIGTGSNSQSRRLALGP